MEQIRCTITSEIFWVNSNESIREDYDLFCPYCDFKLEANGRKFQHARVPFELGEIQSSMPGGRGQGIILTHGFTNNLRHKKDYGDWVNSIRAAGWKGSIWGLWWNAGDPLITASTLFFGMELEYQLAGLPGFLRSKMIQIKKNWNNARKEANNAGRLLGKFLLYDRPSWAKNRLILMGFSLGAQTICKALETGGKSKKFIADEVYLYGGAFPVRAPWSTIARGVRTVLHNHISCNDYILKYIYPRGVKSYQKKPIGLYSINPKPKKIINWDVSEYVHGHGGYEKAIREFEQFNYSFRKTDSHTL